MIGKKLPVNGKGYSPSLDVGFAWESPYEYFGLLRDRTSNTLTLLIRPSIEF
jgi:hypothetical protein